MTGGREAGTRRGINYDGVCVGADLGRSDNASQLCVALVDD